MPVLAVLIWKGSPSGTSLNPARSEGPAVAFADLADLRLYLLGPMFGAVMVAVTWRRREHAAQLKTAKLFHDPSYPCSLPVQAHGEVLETGSDVYLAGAVPRCAGSRCGTSRDRELRNPDEEHLPGHCCGVDRPADRMGHEHSAARDQPVVECQARESRPQGQEQCQRGDKARRVCPPSDGGGDMEDGV